MFSIKTLITTFIQFENLLMFGLYEKRLFEIFLNEDFKTSDTQTHTHEAHQHPLTNQMAVSLLNRGESSAPTSL